MTTRRFAPSLAFTIALALLAAPYASRAEATPGRGVDMAQASGPIDLTAQPPQTQMQAQQQPSQHQPGYGQEFMTPGSSATNSRIPDAGAASAVGSSAATGDLPTREVRTLPVAPATSGNVEARTDTGAVMTAPPLDPEALRDARALILSSEATVYRLMSDSGVQKSLNDLLPRAKALLIVPSFTRAGFILGGAWGNGSLVARLPNGQWSAPAFYRLTAGSVGLQAGIQDNEMIYVIMTDAGLRAVMEDQFKGGATASATFLFVGGGADASTTSNVGADIYGFSQSVGLYGGVNLEGTAVEPRFSWNRAIYGE